MNRQTILAGAASLLAFFLLYSGTAADSFGLCLLGMTILAVGLGAIPVFDYMHRKGQMK